MADEQITQPNPGGSPPSQTPGKSSTTETNDAWAIDKLDAPYKEHLEKNGYKSLSDVIKSDISTRALVGADKSKIARIPAQSRSENPGAWAEFDKAIGVPADGKYGDYKPAKGELGATPDQLGKFDAAMAKAGATKDARNAALEAFHVLNTEAIEAQRAAMQQAKADADTALRQKFGLKYGEKMEAAKTAVDDLDGAKEFGALLKSFGLDDHPHWARLRADIAELRAEDGPPDVNDPGGKNQVAMTPAEAHAKIAAKQADEPFWQGRYLKGDAEAVKEMSVLYAAAAGSA